MRRLRDTLISWGPLGLFIIAILDNAGPPSPGGTDIVLVILAAARPENAMVYAGFAALGALIGSAIFFEVLRKGGEKLLAKYTCTPRGARFKDWTQRYGLATVFIAALIPLPVLPFKVFVACTAAMGAQRTRFFLVLALARVPRYLALAYLGAKFGEKESQIWLKGHVWYLAGLVILIGLALFLIVRRAERLRELEGELQ